MCLHVLSFKNNELRIFLKEVSIIENLVASIPPMKSQLELYLEGLDHADVGSSHSEEKSLTNTAVWATWLNISTAVFDVLTSTLARGWIKDCRLFLGYFNTNCKDNADWPLLNEGDILRWVVIMALLVSAIVFAGNGLSFILLSLSMSSLLVAFVIASSMQRVDHQFYSCRTQFQAILGVIKRLQLVSLGYTISHPLPPIGRVESAYYDDKRGTITDTRCFVCKEMRHDLLLSLTEFLLQMSHLGYVNSDTLHATDVMNKTSRLPTSDYLQELSNLAFDKCSIDLVLYVNKRLLDVERQQSLSVLVTTPLLIANTSLLLSKCHGKLVRISNDLRVSCSLSASVATTPTSESTVHCTAYLRLRSDLTKLRSRFDDISYRLWLCEDALSTPEATQLLLSDNIAASGKTPQISALLESLSRLRGTEGPNTENGSTGLEMIAATLPKLEDVEYIDQQLMHLINSLRNKDQGVDTEIDQPSFEPVVGTIDVMSDNSHLTLAQRNVTQPSEFGEDPSDSEPNNRVDPLSSEARDKQKNQPHVVEVYATVIPTARKGLRSSGNDDSRLDKEDQLRAERELMQAKSLMKELNLHLNRMESATVKVERVRTLVECDSTEGQVSVQQSEGLVINTTTNIVEPSMQQCELLRDSKIHVDERDALSLQPSGVALPDLKSLLASSALRVKQEELCYGSSSDED